MAKQEAPKIQEVKAFARYIHVAPRKIRLLADMIRKTRVEQALEQLKFSSRGAALPLSKVLNSAIANAVHNFNLNKEDLVVKAVTVDGGPVMKRYSPRAQGRAFVIRKRTSHINIVLESRPSQKKKSSHSMFNRTAKAEQVRAAGKPDKHETEEGKVATAKQAPKAAPKTSDKIKQQTVDQKRRLFNRKSGS